MAATAITIGVFRALGVPAEPFTCRVVIFNKPLEKGQGGDQRKRSSQPEKFASQFRQVVDEAGLEKNEIALLIERYRA